MARSKPAPTTFPSRPATASSDSSLSPALEVTERVAAKPSTTSRKRGGADSNASTPNKRVKHAVSKNPIVEPQPTQEEQPVSPPSTKRRRGAKKVKEEEEATETPASTKSKKDKTGTAEVKVEETTPGRNRKRRPAKDAVKEEEAEVNGVKHEDASDSEAEAAAATPSKKRRSKASKKAKVVESSTTVTETTTTKTKSKKSKPPKDLADASSDLSDAPSDAASPITTAKPAKKPRRPRKTAEQKAQEAMPLAVRTSSIPHYIGAHVSAAGGVQNALTNAVHIGGNSLALFLKSQRKWENPPLKDEHAISWIGGCKDHGYEPGKHVVPHGSYLVNLANPDPVKTEQAYTCFLDDLKRCERLGIGLYNLHPGNTNGTPRTEAIARLAAQLNRAHAATSTVVTLLENMAAPPTGNTLGGRFEDVRDVIALISDKSRIGVCFDTCHAFAAGYDLRSPDAFAATFDEFDSVIGPQYLRAMHVNDSKGVLESHRDLHQNIGVGFLGLRSFHNLMNSPRFHGLPLVLETPIDSKNAEGKEVEDKGVWAREIKLLEGLVGMDVEGSGFKKLERDLAAKGTEERAKMQGQFERKEADKVKNGLFGKAKGKGKGKGKGKTQILGESEEDSEGR